MKLWKTQLNVNFTHVMKKKIVEGFEVLCVFFFLFFLQPNTTRCQLLQKSLIEREPSQGRERLLKDHRVGKCVGVAFRSSLFSASLVQPFPSPYMLTQPV